MADRIVDEMNEIQLQFRTAMNGVTHLASSNVYTQTEKMIMFKKLLDLTHQFEHHIEQYYNKFNYNNI